MITRLNLQRNRVCLKLKDLTTNTVTNGDTLKPKGHLEDLNDDDDEAVVSETTTGEQSIAIGSNKIKKANGGVSTASADDKKSAHPSSGSGTTVEVEIDLSMSAYANARSMYAQKKVAYSKEIKSVEANAKVMQHVEEKVLNAVESQKLQRSLRSLRKVIAYFYCFFVNMYGFANSSSS